MGELENLKKELVTLQNERTEKTDISKIKKQIRGEKFAQTKGGKIFNTIGDFGLKIGKKIMTPPKNTGKKKTQKKNRLQDVKDIMDRLPQ